MSRSRSSTRGTIISLRASLDPKDIIKDIKTKPPSQFLPLLDVGTVKAVGSRWRSYPGANPSAMELKLPDVHSARKSSPVQPRPTYTPDQIKLMRLHNQITKLTYTLTLRDAEIHNLRGKVARLELKDNLFAALPTGRLTPCVLVSDDAEDEDAVMAVPDSTPRSSR